jgi:hypothetical protein
MIHGMGNPSPGLGQTQKCGRDKLVNRCTFSTSDNLILYNSTDKNKQSKTCTLSLPLKKTTYYQQKQMTSKT